MDHYITSSGLHWAIFIVLCLLCLWPTWWIIKRRVSLAARSGKKRPADEKGKEPEKSPAAPPVPDTPPAPPVPDPPKRPVVQTAGHAGGHGFNYRGWAVLILCVAVAYFIVNNVDRVFTTHTMETTHYVNRNVESMPAPTQVVYDTNPNNYCHPEDVPPGMVPLAATPEWSPYRPLRQDNVAWCHTPVDNSRSYFVKCLRFGSGLPGECDGGHNSAYAIRSADPDEATLYYEWYEPLKPI